MASTPCSVTVLRELPHDPSAYTQGLIYQDPFFYESTGLNGQSTLRRVIAETGEVQQTVFISPKHFGEGLALWKDRLIQLTWRSNIVFYYDLKSLTQVAERALMGEAWGLTLWKDSLVLSDGSSTLRLLDPVTLAEKKRIRVRDGSLSIDRLNELEAVGDRLYANIWQTDRIAVIDLNKGKVLHWLDLGQISKSVSRVSSEDVLNGIAYRPNKGTFFITGKRWPKLFEIQIKCKK